MTDRELLEKAARAAGIEYEWHHGCGDALHLTAPDATAIYWNPLTDDGDALRLAVKMRFEISLSHDGRDRVFAEVKGRICCGEDSSVDPYAATRRAIVRAAAQMDKDGV